ncbi:hypothetical protein LP420_39875 [Massilia sp. B-10]|nr:hypothetical protein LP420_39875 [Massilia sp. B-10]
MRGTGRVQSRQRRVQTDGGARHHRLHLYQDAAGALADGEHVLILRATDGAGNVSVPLTVQFGFDATAPLIVISGVADGQAYTAPVTATITVSDANSPWSVVLLDGVPYVSGTAITADGVHVLRVDAEDKVGNKSSRTVQFTIGQAARTVVLLTPAQDSYLRTPVGVTGTVTGGSVALAKVEYRVGNNTWLPATATGGGNYARSLTSLPDAAYLLVMRATDTKGGITDSAARRFTVDNTIPLMIVSGVAEGVTYRGAPTVGFVGKDTNLKSSAATLNGQPFATGTVVSADGSYQLVMVAEDLAGNSVTKTVNFRVDRTALKQSRQCVRWQARSGLRCLRCRRT